MPVFKRGRFYWFQFMFNGQRVQKSTKQSDKGAAKDIESAFRTKLAKGEVGLKDKPRAGERATVADLLDRKWESYVEEKRATAANLSQINRAKADFGAKMADALSEEDFARYVESRRKKGARPATINRITDLVRSAYRLAGLPVPKAKHLSEKDNVRRGFFAPAEFAAVEAHLVDWLRDFAQFAHLTGWRAGSISELRWDAVDLDEGEIDLPGEFTKNGEPLKLPIDDELAELLARRKAARRVKTATSAGGSEFVFHRDGKKITQSAYQRPWIRACVLAGQGTLTCRECGEKSARWYCCGKTTKYSGKLLHDFRRTAARDLIRSGTPQSVAMKVTGHKTDSMFRRYNITDTDDIRKALRGLRSYRKEREQKLVAIAK